MNTQVEIKLTKSQTWLLMKSMELLTSDEGVKKIREEFPGLDEEALAEDASGIINQLVTQKAKL
jgi:hypothetical protein